MQAPQRGLAMPASSARIIEHSKALIGAAPLYPLKGIYFIATHRAWWPLFGRRLLPLLLVSLLVYVLLFMFAYLPQVAFLAIFHGPAAFVNALFLVLGEGAVIVSLLFEAFLVDETLAAVFDAILIQGELEDLVSPIRQIDPTGDNAVKKLGRTTGFKTFSPFSFRQIIEFILFLPLNLIPYVGTPAFIILTGARAGPLAHYRYFKMRNLSRKEKSREIRSRRWKYTWFGSVQLMLQLVPVASMFFLLTSAAGAALWAVQLERTRRIVVAQVEAQQDGLVRAATDDRGAPPPYTDDPIP